VRHISSFQKKTATISDFSTYNVTNLLFTQLRNEKKKKQGRRYSCGCSVSINISITNLEGFRERISTFFFTHAIKVMLLKVVSYKTESGIAS
jgi:hypothetical protein